MHAMHLILPLLLASSAAIAALPEQTGQSAAQSVGQYTIKTPVRRRHDRQGLRRFCHAPSGRARGPVRGRGKKALSRRRRRGRAHRRDRGQLWRTAERTRRRGLPQQLRLDRASQRRVDELFPRRTGFGNAKGKTQGRRPGGSGQYLGDEGAVGCAMLEHVHFEVAVPNVATPIDAGGFLLDNEGGKRERNPRFCGVAGAIVAKDHSYRAVACAR